jgi:hypothetical protein
MTVSLPDQIKCARRELAMRRNVYPKWVAGGRMKPDAADRELAGMEAIVASLEEEQLVAQPSATHVFLEDGGFVERIDKLSLEQARQVIVRLCGELQVERQKGTRNVRPSL